MIKFKDWHNLIENTLYHGTIVDNLQSINKYGLHGGWNGPLGKFVSNYYGGDEYGSPNEDDEIVFATNKSQLKKAISAMVFHISDKLGKSYHDVSDNDIRNHGLIVIIKDGSNDAERYSPDQYRTTIPRGLEDGDYFASSFKGTGFLRGSALIRFLKSNNEWPRDWGKGDPVKRNNVKQGITNAINGGKNV